MNLSHSPRSAGAYQGDQPVIDLTRYYKRRKKTFLSTLESILRQIKVSDPEEITNRVDQIVRESLESERELFISSLTDIISKNSQTSGSSYFFHASNSGSSSPNRSKGSIYHDSSNSAILSHYHDDFVQQLSDISQLRCELGIAKANILSFVSEFQNLLNTKKQELNNATTSICANLLYRNSKLESHINRQKEKSGAMIEQLEQKIMNLTSKISDLQVEKKSYKQQQDIEYQNADLQQKYLDAQIQISKLKQELDSKDQTLKDQEDRFNAKIFEYKENLNTTTRSIQDKFVELRTQKARAEKLAKSQTQEIKVLSEQLEEAQKQVSKQANTISILETEHGLAKTAMTLHESDIITNQKQAEQIKELANKLEQSNARIEELEDVNLQLSQSFGEYQTRLSSGIQSQNQLQEEMEHTLLLSDMREKRAQKLKSELQALKKSCYEKDVLIEQNKAKIIELTEQSKDCDYFRTNFTSANLELTKLRKNFKVISKSNKALQDTINEKDSLITELAETNKERELQIDELQDELEKIKNDPNVADLKFELKNKNQEIDEHVSIMKEQQSKIQKLEKVLDSFKQKYYKYETMVKEQSLKIEQLVSKVSQFVETINENESEISELQAILQQIITQKEDIAKKNNELVETFQLHREDIEKELDKVRSENSVIYQNYLDKQREFNDKSEEADSLRSSNYQLKNENISLRSRVQTEIEPLQRENQKYRNKIKSLTSEKQVLAQENSKLTGSFRDLKLQTDAIISRQEVRIEELQEQLNKANTDYDEGISALESHFEELNNNIKSQMDTNRELSAIIVELQKIFDLDSPNDLTKIAGKIVSQNKMLRTTQQKNDELIDKIEKENSELKRAKAGDRTQELLKRVEYLEEALSNETEERQITDSCFNQLKEELSSIKTILDFDSVAALKEHIKELVDAKSQLEIENNENKQHLIEYEQKMTKSTKEIEELKTLNLQKTEQLTAISKSERESKSTIQQQNKQFQQQIFELQQQLQLKNDEMESHLVTINQLKNLVPFDNFDDLVLILNNLIQDKEQALEELKQANELIESGKESSDQMLDSIKSRNQELLKEISNLKDEKIQIKKEKQQLEKEVESNQRTNEKLQQKITEKAQWLDDIKEKLNISSLDDLPELMKQIEEKSGKHKAKIKELKGTAQVITEMSKILNCEQDFIIENMMKLKKEKEDTEKKINDGHHQIKQIISAISSKEIDKEKLNFPLPDQTIEQIIENINQANQAAEENRKNINLIIRQATSTGYTGNSIPEAIDYIKNRQEKLEAENEEAKSSIDDIKRIQFEDNKKASIFKQKQEETQQTLNNTITELREQIKKLEAMKEALISLKAGEEYDKDLLLQELNEYELNQIGLDQEE